MIMRGLSVTGDWLYGKGRNDYTSGIDAIAENIQTRLMSFLGDCFFNKTAGIDWFNLIGGKDRLAVELAVSSTILNTADVTAINKVESVLTSARVLTIRYNVQTTFGTINREFQYQLI